MSLVQDAVPTLPENFNHKKYFFKERINGDVLKQIICDLDYTEMVSIIFLMTDKNTNVFEIIELIQETSFAKFILLTKTNTGWQEKLIEILIIIGNFNVIRKLGFNETQITSMKEQFVSNIHNVTPNLNRVIKSLYFVCESLNGKEVDKLITEVNKSLNVPLITDKSTLCLELYMLHWMKEKYITIDQNNPDLNNLIQTLKKMGLLYNLPFNFEYWKNIEVNQQTIKNDNSLQHRSCNNPYSELQKDFIISWSEEHKRLCLIINEINFTDNIKYKTRLGSNIDEENLKNTFKGCKFDIKVYRDLTKIEMMKFLNSLNESPYNNYGSIFICILSHGYEGEVVFSDGETVAIKIIEEKFCCQNLQKVFKFVILQSCQGKQIGTIERNLNVDESSKLVTDGPTCPIYHMHFGLFQATISSFAAMRNESKGTWFIQDICDELKKSTPVTVKEWVQAVTKRLSNRRDKSKYYNKDIVQVPRFISSMSVDYLLPQYVENC
ncbi:PREDICTED: caspase-8-like [Ceratosolen solmsi marchali]|uniref:Caspase-8-like n=1 Tax=Ceratosolen solmsi marchali TaxID=326594 RepID=A0AAJ6YCC2_9HYME|nr:PREDICTED: caspase-8-like [Ceratosolen solmsi marchali]